MKRRALTTALLFGWMAGPALAADPLPALKETPMLADQVKSGALPPIGKRIPQQPWVVTQFAGGDGPGQQGGQLNMLVASARDTRLMTIYSYTRLIIHDDKFKLKPDILESYEDKDGREFTFKLRAGHKWSDGEPFTTEDFRFFWEDVANNKELSSSGPSVELLVDGKPPKVEIIDPLTIKYTWEKPNPYFIESQARAAPLFLFRPAHYLKKFHTKYTPEAEILKSVKGGQQNWVQVYKRLDVMYANDNIDLPTLNPWVNTTASPAQRFVYLRNPYYHRIDAKGQQLPYIDRVIFTVAATNLVPAKAGLGEADLQPRYLNMRDYTFLDYQIQNLIPASYDIEDPAFSTNIDESMARDWVDRTTRNSFIEPALHNDSSIGDPPTAILGKGLFEHVSNAGRNLGIRICTCGRHAGGHMHPETIDAMDYLYEQDKHILGMCTFCYYHMIEYGVRDPNVMVGGTIGGKPL